MKVSRYGVRKMGSFARLPVAAVANWIRETPNGVALIKLGKHSNVLGVATQNHFGFVTPICLSSKKSSCGVVAKRPGPVRFELSTQTDSPRRR